MKKLLLLSFAFLFLLSTNSCIQEENLEQQFENEFDTILKIEKDNQEIISTFKAEVKKVASSKRLSGKLSDILSQEEVKTLFLTHLEEYKVLKDGKIHTLKIDYDMQTLFEQVIEKSLIFESIDYSRNRTNSVPPTREEIRDALRDECDTYIWIVSEPCKVAVDLAYILG